MSTAMIQIRNVPADVHRALKSRAAQAGMSLSDYLLREITCLTERPVLEDVLARIKQRGATRSPPAARSVRAERDGR
jgi:plasmid stability protein